MTYPIEEVLVRTYLYFFAIIFLLLFSESTSTHARSIDELKAGVVKVTATTEGKVRIGTGFIVKIEHDTAYIVTASHLIEGSIPIIGFFPRPDEEYPGTTKHMEGGNPKGLAILQVNAPLPDKIQSLSVASEFKVRGGESAIIIGFPRVPPVPWAVSKGILNGQIGSNLILSDTGTTEGNSGSPILVNNQVVGILTEILEDFGYGVPFSILRVTLSGWGIDIDEQSQTTKTMTRKFQNAYPMTEYLMTTGQGMIDEGRQVCQLTADLMARGELAKQISIEMTEHFQRTTKKREGLSATNDWDFLLEESTQQLLANSKIIERRIEKETGICTSIAVMPREHINRHLKAKNHSDSQD